MKISTILTVSTIDKKYASSVIPFIQAWRAVLPGVRIVVYLVCDEIPDMFKEYVEVVVLHPVVENQASQSQLARLFLPKYQPDDGAVLITDVNTLPISRWFFTQFNFVPDDVMLCTRGNIREIVWNKKEIQVTYCIASPNTWKEIFPEPLDYLKELDLHWSKDQELLFERINNHPKKYYLHDEQTNHLRLENPQMTIEYFPLISRSVHQEVFTEWNVGTPFPDNEKCKFILWLIQQKDTNQNVCDLFKVYCKEIGYLPTLPLIFL